MNPGNTKVIKDKSESIGFYKIRSVGNGLSITVPNGFVQSENLKKGMWVKVTWTGHILKVEPIKNT